MGVSRYYVAARRRRGDIQPMRDVARLNYVRLYRHRHEIADQGLIGMGNSQ